LGAFPLALTLLIYTTLVAVGFCGAVIAGVGGFIGGTLGLVVDGIAKLCALTKDTEVQEKNSEDDHSQISVKAQPEPELNSPTNANLFWKHDTPASAPSETDSEMDSVRPHTSKPPSSIPRHFSHS
jgi:hypothetical protein